MNKNIFVMDEDTCPKYDTIIMQGLCKGCEYYCDFELYKGQRCIGCSYFYSEEIKNKE